MIYSFKYLTYVADDDAFYSQFHLDMQLTRGIDDRSEFMRWTSGSEVLDYRAICTFGLSGDDVPGEKCSCGVYGAKTMKILSSYKNFIEFKANMLVALNFARRIIVAPCIIAHWGKVLEYESGYRSEYACLIAILYSRDSGDALKRLPKTKIENSLMKKFFYEGIDEDAINLCIQGIVYD